MAWKKPPVPAPLPPRAPAAHVAASLSRQVVAPKAAAQPSSRPAPGAAQAQSSPARPPLAAHVSAAIQLKPAVSGRPPAAAHLLKGIQAAQAKPSPLAAGRSTVPLVPPRPAAAQLKTTPAVAAARPAKAVLQPMFLLNWLLPRKREESTQDFQYQAGAAAPAVTHTMTVTNSPTKKGRLRSIDMQIGDGAHLTGEITPGGEAFINHVASGRFGGRRVGNLLILRFAKLAKKEGVTRIRLGNAVNTASYLASGDRDASIETAIHMYTQLGFNVSTRAAAEATSLTPQQLIAAATPLVHGRWTNPAAAAEAAAEAEMEAEENADALGSFLEQMLMG